MIKKLAVLLLLAYATYYTTYTIHEKYNLPFHSDEWDHLALSMHLAKTGSLESVRAYNPFTDLPYRVNRESGYHLLLALLYLSSGLDKIGFAVLIPTIFAFILAVNTLALVNRLTKSLLAGLVAGVFSLTLKSNVTLLGIWFMVPMSAGIALAPLILLLLVRALNHEREFNWFDPVLILVVAVTLLVHPPSATVYIPIALVYLAYNWRIILEKRRKMLAALFAGLVGTVAFMVVTSVPLSSLASPLDFIREYLYFTSEDLSMLYSYPTFLGKSVIALAAVGVYFMVHSEKKEERVIPLSVISLLPLVAEYYHTEHVLFSTYHRIFMFAGEMVLILAGVGLYYIYHTIVSFVLEKTKDRILVLIVGGFVLGLIYLTVVAPQVASTFKYKNRLYHVIEESDVSPIMWLANNTPNGSVVVAAPSVSKAITPLSGRHVVAIERTMMRSSPERYGDASHFFQPNCDCACKDVRIERYGINYVYTRKSVDCPSLPLVHSENGVNIYKVADLINQEEIT